MKKRIRKKKHIGEFDKFGIILTFDVSNDKIEEVIDFVNDFADAHGLYAWGGGYGSFSTQKVDDNYDIPTIVVDIMMAIVHRQEEKPVFCIYSPKSLRISKEDLAEVETTLGGSPYKMKIGPKQISLWHL